MKHCKEMAAAHQKMMDSQKAMKEKHDAAWKEIEAELDTAKKATGEKKVAALESVVEKLSRSTARCSTRWARGCR